MKQCSKCGIEKPLTEFQLRSDTGRHRSQCRQCISAANLARYHTKPSTKQAHREAARRHSLKKYGLTPEDFSRMHEEQGGECAICDAEIPAVSEDRYLSACVDHDHKTGKVRGLLCWDCNVGLGKFLDNPDLLVSAAEYLRKNE